MVEPPIKHIQHSYATTDIQRAKLVFAEDHGDLTWFDLNATLPLSVPANGQMQLKIALTTIGGVEIELIQPIAGDAATIYTELLPTTGFGLVLHHLGYEVVGPRENWDQFRAGIDTEKYPVILEGGVYGTKFVYLDARQRLGHYSEYIWFENRQAPAAGQS